MSATLIPLTIAPFAAGSVNPVMDATICFGLLIHTYIGFQWVFDREYVHAEQLMSYIGPS